MGYSTDFSGSFDLSKKLTEAQKEYLFAFANIRHTVRTNSEIESISDPIRKAVKLPLGANGEFFVSDNEKTGVVDRNTPPSTQPGLWCQWIPSEDGKSIIWDGGEKFYRYTEWMNYIIESFLIPWGIEVSGRMRYFGGDSDDMGILKIVKGKCVCVPLDVTGTLNRL